MAKFCTKCGKKLEDGEVCTCSTQNAAPQAAPQPTPQAAPQQPVYQQPNAGQQMYQQPGQQMYQQPGQPMYQQPGQQMYQQPGQPMYQQPMYPQQPNQFVTGMKSMFSELLPILKAPVTATKNIAARGSNAIGLELLGCKAIIAVIMVLILLAKVNGQVEGFVEIPWFNAILLVAFITIGADCLEAVLMKTFCGAFKGTTTTPAMFTVVGSRAVFDSIFIVLTALSYMISFQLTVVVIAVGICLTSAVQYSAYAANVQIAEDKKVYAFFAARAITVLAVLLVVYLLGKDLMGILAVGMLADTFSSLGSGMGSMGSLKGLF